jgi:hypothetical protein
MADAERRCPVSSLAHDDEPVRGQDLTGDRPEGRMVVDDHDPVSPARPLTCPVGGCGIVRARAGRGCRRGSVGFRHGGRGRTDQLRARLPESGRDQRIVAVIG